MKVLHVLKSEPDETTNKLMDIISGNDKDIFVLYEENVDWDKFIDEVFSHEKVICWW
ncbi:hypothetical protein JCM13304A_04220 [Desulfothermus okinawensis JCM 13304]